VLTQRRGKARIPRHRHPREDRHENVRSACHMNNFRKSRVSDVSARILARMSVSVSASWNSSLLQAVDGWQDADVTECQHRRLECPGCNSRAGARPLRHLDSFIQPARPSVPARPAIMLCFVGPIPWGHSGPLCHALSLSSLSTLHAACAIAIAGVRLATPGDWQCNGGSQ